MLAEKCKTATTCQTNIELFLLRKAEKSEVNIFFLGTDSDLQADLLNIFTNYFQRSEKRDYYKVNMMLLHLENLIRNIIKKRHLNMLE